MRKWNLPETKLNYLVSYQAVNGEKQFCDQVCQILQKASGILEIFFPLFVQQVWKCFVWLQIR